MEQLTFIDFFAGIGGFRKGMEMAGHKCLGYCEYDSHAVYSYKAMHLLTQKELEQLRKTENYKQGQKYINSIDFTEREWYANDIRTVRVASIPKAEVWCFGFPCQDISIAGNQAGFSGKRSSLFFTVTGLIRDLSEENKPKYLFIENVKNLLSINGGSDFARLLLELDEIGYDAEWSVLNSAGVVPQNRERVFIIGHHRSRSTRNVFPITKSGQETSIIQGQQANTITAMYGGKANEISQCLNKMDDSSRKPLIIVRGNVNPSGKGMNGQVYDTNGLSPTLTTNKGEGIKIVMPVLAPDRGNILITSPNQGAIVGNRIRKLIPKECFRLQTWSDKDFEKAALVNSDCQLYKQAGNGVTVLVIYEIAKGL